MEINRNKHPILTQSDFSEFTERLTEIEKEALIEALNQQLIDKQVIAQLNKKITEIEDKIDSARNEANQAYHLSIEKNHDKARDHALESYWGAGQALDDISALKEKMRIFE